MNKTHIILLEALAIVVLVLYITQCQGPSSLGEGEYSIERTSDTVYISDTTVRELYTDTTVFIPKIVERPVIDSTGNSIVDSLLIELQTLRTFIDTISDDSVDIFITETIGNNTRKNLDLYYRIKFPTQNIINNTTIINNEPVNKWFIGGSLMYNPDWYLGPKLTLKDKKDNLYSLSVMVSPQAKTGFNLSFSKRIKKIF